MKRHTKEEKIAILKQQGTGTMQQLADKTGVGLSTLTAWKAQLNGKAKKKVAKKVTKPAEKKFDSLYDKYIYHRDEAEKAREELKALVEQLR